MNDRTNASQWDFPAEEEKEEDIKGSQASQVPTSNQVDAKTSSASTGGITGQLTKALSGVVPNMPNDCLVS